MLDSLKTGINKFIEWIKSQEPVILYSYITLFVFIVAFCVATPMTYTSLGKPFDDNIRKKPNFSINYILNYSDSIVIEKYFKEFCESAETQIEVILTTNNEPLPSFIYDSLKSAIQRNVRVKIYTDSSSTSVPKDSRFRSFPKNPLTFNVNFAVFDKKSVLVPSRFYHSLTANNSQYESSYMFTVTDDKTVGNKLHKLFDMFWNYPSRVQKYTWADYPSYYKQYFSFLLYPSEALNLNYSHLNIIKEVMDSASGDIYVWSHSLYPENMSTKQYSDVGTYVSHLFETEYNVYNIYVSKQAFESNPDVYNSMMPSLSTGDSLYYCDFPFYGTIMVSAQAIGLFPFTMYDVVTQNNFAIGLYINLTSQYFIIDDFKTHLQSYSQDVCFRI